jgi:hypothetical protein
MKSRNILWGLSFICLSTQGQIVITSSSFPNSGDIAIQFNDTLPVISPGSPGPNQFWNLDDLHMHVQDTVFFENPTLTPNGNLFPTADVSRRLKSDYDYLKVGSSEVENIGFSGDPGNGYHFDVLYQSPGIFRKAGTTYNTSNVFWQTFLKEVDGASYGQPNCDSIRIDMSTKSTRTVDGWGVVSDPIGDYYCLRMKCTDSLSLVVDAKVSGQWIMDVYDSIGVSHYFQFIDDNSPEPIVNLHMDKTGSFVDKATFRMDLPVTTGLSKTSPNSNQNFLYPNPVKNDSRFFIMMNNATGRQGYSISIHNSFGVPILHKTEFQNSGQGQYPQEFSTTGWKQGIYFVRISLPDQPVQTLKLLVNDH